MDLQNKQVIIIGTGLSGIGACKLLLQAGAKVTMYEGNPNADLDAIIKKLPQEVMVPILVAAIPEETYVKTELAIVSPGVPTDTGIVAELANRKITIWGELELAWNFGKGRVIAITGTNGKTTTTALVGKIMSDYYNEVYVVGNIGTPYTSVAAKMQDDSVTVVEVSSFQLETIETFHPSVAAILNVTPDHLDRHHTMENYASVKERIGLNQTKEDTIILNYDNEYTIDAAKRAKANVLFFSKTEPLRDGIYLSNDMICYAKDGMVNELLCIYDMNILGGHNVENAMAAIGMAMTFGVPMEHIISSVKAFQAVEHRIEFVTTKNGVDYYNDSKATNTDAAIKGIQAMRKPTFLIGGGYDKDATYEEWIESFQGKVKLLVLIGATKEKIAECAGKSGFMDVMMAESLEEAVAVCANNAKEGEAVLLSPACASWGMFSNFEERGNVFKKLVYQL